MKLRIVYKSYRDNPHVSHAGLGIAAINTAKTLQQAHLDAQAWAIKNSDELIQKLFADPSITHIVIQAPWIESAKLIAISHQFSYVKFAVSCHSNVGFLQTDPHGMNLMLDLLDIEQSTHNVFAAGNSRPFTEWLKDAYHGRCILLPNLYFLDDLNPTDRPLFRGGNLKVGIFGAPRPQKNILTGVAGAIELAETLKTHTEIWVNRGRDERHGVTILESCKIAIERNPFTTYHELHWTVWPQFRRFVGSMNLLIQASYSESFNQVCADGAATGIPSVVSSAITWAPDHWKANCDDANSVARIGRYLLLDPHAGKDGLNALKRHNQSGILFWKQFLKV